MVIRAPGVFASGSLSSRSNKGYQKAVFTAFGEAQNIYKREAKAILKEAGQIILDAARANIKNDTGALAASGRVEVIDTPKGPKMEVIFGGEDNPVSPTRNTRGGVGGDGVVDYAFFVHEDIHPAGVPQPSAKYLEKAELANRERVIQKIAKGFANATKLKKPRR